MLRPVTPRLSEAAAGAMSETVISDMWEHAYYLQYQNVKGDWVIAFWKVVNWEDVAQRFHKVRTLDLGL
jgi:superoxide dismutase, Fe-Mn family